MNNAVLISVLLGLAFGIALVWLGPGQAFAVLAFGIIGWVVGKIVAREVDVMGWLNRLSGRQ